MKAIGSTTFEELHSQSEARQTDKQWKNEQTDKQKNYMP